MPIPAAQTDEYRAARESAARVDLSLRELVRVTGPDRLSFVQGMVTNDVEALAPGASCYAAMLTPKGAMVADLRVLRRADDLVLDTGPGLGATVKDFLNKYLISEEAELADAPELALVGLLGPTAMVLVERLGADALATLPPLFGVGADVLVNRARLAAVAEALSDVPLLSTDTQEVLRVEAGAPRFGVDMTDTTIPLEANLERALHYNKGCYIGQEVIARATYRGQMNKKLMGLLLGELSAEKGTELKKAGKKVGWVTSVVRSVLKGQNVALGYVHRDFLEPGLELELADGHAVVTALPFA